MIHAGRLWIAGLLLAGVTQGWAAKVVLTVTGVGGTAGGCSAPASARVDLTEFPKAALRAGQFRLTAIGETNRVQATETAAQFEPDAPGTTSGTLRWLTPPGVVGEWRFTVKAESHSMGPLMQVRRDGGSGQFELSEGGKPVLRYNYQTNEPGEVLARVSPDNQKYARARSDYIHPLYGPDGQELTKDWPLEHPHHRGIYWAWPEVDYHDERGDLHALQRVFSRPTGKCTVEEGAVCAVIEAENLWRWEDKEPIVREGTLIRAWRSGATGRFIDLEFRFNALKDDVALARRGMTAYGGLNIRMAPVQEQEIFFHTDPEEKGMRGAWAELSGVFGNGRKAGLAVFQAPSNPDYPGDWIKYPELNWFQPTFPASGTRYVLKQGQPLVLRFRLWICVDKADEAKLAEGWSAYAYPPQATISRQ